jgi:hypothetical protein
VQGCGPPVATCGTVRWATRPARGRSASGCGTDDASSPTTPWTSPATLASNSGDALLANAILRPEAASREKEIENACATAPAVAVIGIASPFALTVPGSRPCERREDCTAATCAVVGPNRRANCAGVM